MKRFVPFVLLALSVLLVANGPMTSYVYAQSANNELLELKDKAIKEIDRRIVQYQKTLESLQVNVQFDKITVSLDGTTGQTASANPDLGEDIALPVGMKDQAGSFLEKIVEQLTGLKVMIQDTSSLPELKGLASNLDAQFGINQLTNVQAIVVQSVESMTGVLDKLKTTFVDMQQRATDLQDCADGVLGGTASADMDVSVDGATVKCNSTEINVVDEAGAALSDLGDWAKIIQQISSVLLSVVTLLVSLASTFSKYTGGLGSLGSMGNLGNLGSLTSGGGLSSLTGGSKDISSMMSGFSGIVSQLGLTQLMAGDVQGGLSAILGNLPSLLSAAGGAGGFDMGAGLKNAQGGLPGFLDSLGGTGGFGGGFNGGSNTNKPSNNTNSNAATARVGKAGDFTGARSSGTTFREGARTGNCIIDYSRVSTFAASLAKSMVDLCNTELSKIEQVSGKLYHLPPVQFVVVPNIYKDNLAPANVCEPKQQAAGTSKSTTGGYAITGSGRFYLCGTFFGTATQMDANGKHAIVHELIHLTQRYATTSGLANVKAPYWLTESVTYHMGVELGYPPNIRIPSTGEYHGCLPGDTYNRGYWCGDALLHYIMRQYNIPNLVKRIHDTSQRGNYTDSTLTSGTGRSLNQLWSECLKAECKGGAQL